MRPREDSACRPLQVQALYSIATLARAANVTTSMLRRILRANGVTLVRGGRALYVPLSEIKNKIPPLWASLHDAEQLRRLAGAATHKKLRPPAS